MFHLLIITSYITMTSCHIIKCPCCNHDMDTCSTGCLSKLESCIKLHVSASTSSPPPLPLIYLIS